ncbi:tripartite tricarboxylate transporter substrate binding protein [Achromobacter sp. LC458]|uniref:Tripartite tricarboxylate transporter substrate binding protein n=1 Tax=Achromobacter spanius TaxID=217203 RepID=A0A2S5GN08_9BURK|nr:MULTISPECIES: tripartite tricarboxylate transporter substrate binding protein [Achromobacter]MDX3987016.1 tripartite tricarboxylate transporter substrate binding protein [Achromobacter sp.]PPA74477.1 tripartite tricarboxylate transporter substrate binding protein [Achromobacter spanius]QYJ21811.1 tripartite tricarboxylate transporter substrate binding protein [Achromobacter sp. ES-001]TRM54624.1 tripartite tricarboxylate transporter substrate binding protein [Achromobacter sp. LC458]HCQ4773
MFRTPIRYAAGLLVACSAAFAATPAMAAWPDKPITFVAPFSAGGANDLVARIIAKAVGTTLKQSVIVENRPGAGGVVGAAHVARSAADGYTYLVGSNGTVTNSLIRSDQPYKDDELTPVALLTITPSVIVANPSNPAKDLKDFVERAKKAKTDRITFSTAGNGSTPHFVAEMVKEATGLPIEPIAYKSGSEGVTAVIGNQVDATSEASIVTLPLIQSGKLKALATTWDKRMASAPDIPTTAEAGFPAVRIGHWAGLYAPAGTPADVLDKMNAAVEQSLQTKEVQDALRQSSIEPGGGSRASFVEFAASERERLGKIVKNGHMQTQ